MRPFLSAFLLAAPALVLLLGLALWPLLFLLRMSLYEGGGGRGGFGLGRSFYVPGTYRLDRYLDLWADSYFREVFGFTVWLGFVAATLALVLAYPTALVLYRLKGRFKVLVLLLVILAKMSSLLVTLYGLKLILGDYGPVNQAFLALGFASGPLALQNNALGVLIGKTVLILPYPILMLWVAFERIDPNLIAAARGLGADAFTSFRAVVWPLTRPAFSAATLLCLIFGLGAFVSPYLLGGPDEITLAVDLQRQMFENLDWPRAAAGGVILVVLIAASAFLIGLSYILRWMLSAQSGEKA